MPLDHVNISVAQWEVEVLASFLLNSLKHMGFKEIMRPVPFCIGMGEMVPYLWIVGSAPEDCDHKTQQECLRMKHVAFSAESGSYFPACSSILWPCPTPKLAFFPCIPLTDFDVDPDQIQQFHAAALKAGATCNGPPGLRPDYHPGYYAAYVRDPVCGVNFEMVCHDGAGEKQRCDGEQGGH